MPQDLKHHAHMSPIDATDLEVVEKLDRLVALWVILVRLSDLEGEGWHDVCFCGTEINESTLVDVFVGCLCGTGINVSTSLDVFEGCLCGTGMNVSALVDVFGGCLCGTGLTNFWQHRVGVAWNVSVSRNILKRVFMWPQCIC